MIHNKRQEGILIANLIEKSKEIDLKNINTYPKKDHLDSLKFNQHTLKLSFNYKNTSICENGCYLLISYYKEKYDSSIENPNLVGYEYTIFSRIWDYLEDSPQIINIPFNECVFGSFDRGSITHHYYSIFIPNDTDKIVIQLEANYIDCFIGEGIVKLNTLKNIEEIKNLNIINNTNVLELTKENLKLDFKNKYITLALRSKNYFEETFSFYIFRILYFKEKETIYYPADSNFGNLCLPKLENNKYYCNFILKNNYNELSTDFTIAGTNQIEYFKIHYAKVSKNVISSEIKFN